MNTKFLITAWVLLLGADELLMQVFKQIAQLLSSGATQESMQILYISGISLCWKLKGISGGVIITLGLFWI